MKLSKRKNENRWKFWTDKRKGKWRKKVGKEKISEENSIKPNIELEARTKEVELEIREEIERKLWRKVFAKKGKGKDDQWSDMTNLLKLWKNG